VLYEDEQLQIGVKAEYHGNLGRIALYLGNKIAQPFTSFSGDIECPEPQALVARFHKPPAKEVPGLEQVQYLLEIECKATFTAHPLLRISFIAGTVRNLVLRLPVYLTRFVEPVQLNAAAFFERWKVIGGGPMSWCFARVSSADENFRCVAFLGPPREAQMIFPIELTSEGEVDLERNAKVVSGHKLSLLEGIDPNPHNVSSGPDERTTSLGS
jgi:AP-2 complex subunit alpha